MATSAAVLQGTEKEASTVFEPPNWAAPLELRAYQAVTPSSAMIRGMFPNALVRVLAERRVVLPDAGPYVAFKNYPVRAFLDVIYRSARALYPQQPTRVGVRKLARHCFDAFRDSMAGRVVLGAFDGDVAALLRAAPQAYRATQSEGRVEVLESGVNACVLQYRGLHQFLDCFEVGIIEAAVASCGHTAECTLALDSLSSGRVRVCWT